MATRLQWPPRWGAAGLTASFGIAGWVEFILLSRGLQARIGRADVPAAFVGRLWAAALAGAALAWGVKLFTVTRWPGHPALTGIAVLLPYGLAYLAAARLLGVAEARQLVAGMRRAIPRRR